MIATIHFQGLLETQGQANYMYFHAQHSSTHYKNPYEALSVHEFNTTTMCVIYVWVL